MIKHNVLASRFIAQVEKLGFNCDRQTAGTGTVYVTVDGFKARFADHGECYCREDVSVDPDGVEWFDAVIRFCERAEVSAPAAIKRLATIRANKRAAYSARRAAEAVAQRVYRTSDAFRAAEAREAAVEPWIAAQGIDLTSLSAKGRKKWRQRARAALTA